MSQNYLINNSSTLWNKQQVFHNKEIYAVDSEGLSRPKFDLCLITRSLPCMLVLKWTANYFGILLTCE